VPGGDDHGRRLAPAGLAQLPDLAAQVMAALGSARLDLVLCSPSARTLETVAGLVAAEPALGDAPVRVKRRLYLAGVEDLLAALRRVPDDLETVMVCGHNPGLHELALTLLGDAAGEQLRQGLPTAGLAVVELDDVWSHISR